MFSSANTSALPSARGSRSQRRSTASAGAQCVRRQHTGTEQLEQLLDKPELVVVEQPKERGMRFRYECEGRSAGSILGASSTDVNKTLPTIELKGPIERIKNVTVTVSLVTKDLPHRPHPHCLVGKDCLDGICVISFNPHNTRRHSFVNLGIQCVRRKELDTSLMKRKKKNIDPFGTGHSKSIEDMDMNVVRLCFQCDLDREDGERTQLYPVVSNPIYDKKATTTAELKINRLNIVQGPCTGKTEIYMLCDKVQKDDIEIIFSLGNWEGKAEFAQTDVHRQIAIVFKSPPYQEQDIGEEVEVNVSLRRISDRMYSEPVKFTYMPHNPESHGPVEIISHWHPNLTINMVDDHTAWVKGSVPPPLDQYIQFWNSRQSLEGLSVRSIIFGVFQSLVVLLYILDNETNFVVQVSVFIGLLIDFWKITKVMDVKLDRENKIVGLFPRLVFKDKSTYVKSSTKIYDDMAFKYLSWLLYPLFGCYAVYSLIYVEHKGWYSWVLGMLYGFLLTFGFITMTPQLFINYKMKSVAHLPWRMLTYKALNTFIDDLFAFVIKMPMMYRIGCLRDDVVFFIYLYQRWIYRVDPKRVNEFGTSGLDQSKENSAQATEGDTATAAVTDKPEEEKKND